MLFSEKDIYLIIAAAVASFPVAFLIGYYFYWKAKSFSALSCSFFNEVMLFNTAVRDIPGLTILHEGQPVSNSLILSEFVLFNIGREDLVLDNSEHPLFLRLPENYTWINVHLKQPEGVKCAIQKLDSTLLINWGLMKPMEVVYCKALVERRDVARNKLISKVAHLGRLKDSGTVHRSIKVDQRIPNLKTYKKWIGSLFFKTPLLYLIQIPLYILFSIAFLSVVSWTTVKLESGGKGYFINYSGVTPDTLEMIWYHRGGSEKDSILVHSIVTDKFFNVSRKNMGSMEFIVLQDKWVLIFANVQMVGLVIFLFIAVYSLAIKLPMDFVRSWRINRAMKTLI